MAPIPPHQPTVLLTGCSPGGIGHSMAAHFAALGYHVFATLREPSRLHSDALAALSNVEILELDVTAPATIARCREVVALRAGNRLDVLVNNAGVECNCPLLDTDLDEARRLFEVNVWGPLAVVQAFAPLLVAAQGTVFNQSSIDAELNMVWAGGYRSDS